MAAHLYWLFFSFEGRIDRATFIKAFFAQLAVNLSLQFVIVLLARANGPDAAHRVLAILEAQGFASAALLALSGLLAWASLAIHFKRLHDFGWSGLWLIAPSAGMAVCALLSMPFFLMGHAGVGIVFVVVASVLSGLGSLFLAAKAFFQPGAEGENGHPRGPDDAAPRPLNARKGAAPRAERVVYRAAVPSGQGFGRRGVRA